MLRLFIAAWAAVRANHPPEASSLIFHSAEAVNNGRFSTTSANTQHRTSGWVGGGWRVHVGVGSCLRGVRNDCFLIFNLSNGPHLLYHRWSCERTPRGPKAALTEHMPLLQNFDRAAISKKPRRLILAPHRWTQEGAEPQKKSRKAISSRATSDGVCWTKRGLSKWSK